MIEDLKKFVVSDPNRRVYISFGTESDKTRMVLDNVSVAISWFEFHACPVRGMSWEEWHTARQAKIYAEAEIGPELEMVVGNLAPKCAVCGGIFGKDVEMVMQGMDKLHLACRSGKPCFEKHLTPGQAIST